MLGRAYDARVKLAYGGLDIVLAAVYVVSLAFLTATRIRFRHPVTLGDVITRNSHFNRQLAKGIIPVAVGVGLAGSLVAGEDLGLTRLVALLIGTALVVIPLGLAARSYDPTPDPGPIQTQITRSPDPLGYSNRIATLEDSLLADGSPRRPHRQKPHRPGRSDSRRR
jgi:hypothetical protein